MAPLESDRRIRPIGGSLDMRPIGCLRRFWMSRDRVFLFRNSDFLVWDFIGSRYALWAVLFDGLEVDAHYIHEDRAYEVSIYTALQSLTLNANSRFLFFSVHQYWQCYHLSGDRPTTRVEDTRSTSDR